MNTLWDTDAADISQALRVERRNSGAVAFGVVLTLVAITDKEHAGQTIDAAHVAAAAHPCRLIVVVPTPGLPEPRVDAEVGVGGGLGTGETIVLRCYGPLTEHLESVVLPLLAPDTPVVAWWADCPPDHLRGDHLAALAGRRVTDAAASTDPIPTLRARLAEYSPGDTDLAWTRTTLWRQAIAGALDPVTAAVTRVELSAEECSPTAALLAGWLSSRLGDEVAMTLTSTSGRGISSARFEFADGAPQLVHRVNDSYLRFERDGRVARELPVPFRDPGELLLEELRHLDPDSTYAAALRHLPKDWS